MNSLGTSPLRITQLILMQPGSILRKLSRVSFRPIPPASPSTPPRTTPPQTSKSIPATLQWRTQSPNSLLQQLSLRKKLLRQRKSSPNSPPPSSASTTAWRSTWTTTTTCSARPGTRFIRPARPHGAPCTSHCANSSARG